MEFIRSLSSGSSRYQSLTGGGGDHHIHHFTNAGKENTDSLDDIFHARLEKNLHYLNETVSLSNVVRTAPQHLQQLLTDIQDMLLELKDSWSQLLENSNGVSVNLSINTPHHVAKPAANKPIYCWPVRRSMSIPKALPVTPRKAIIKYLHHVIVNLHDQLSILKGDLLRLNLSFGEDDQKKIVNDVYRYQTQLGVLKQEMQTLIPNIREGVFNWKFKCAKAEVESWWQSHFNDNFILDWSDFIQVFAEHFKLKSSNIVQEMQLSMNFSHSDYMSKYKLDLFTRLFSPWTKLSQVWKVLVMDHPGFSGMSNYEEASERLKLYLNQPGSYIFRYSATKFGFWSIAYVKQDKTVAHVLLKDLTLVEALVMGERQKIYRFPRGRLNNPDVKDLLEPTIRIPIEDVSGEFSFHQDVSSSSTPTPSPDMYHTHANNVQAYSLSNAINNSMDHGGTTCSSNVACVETASTLRPHSINCQNDETFSCSICFENKKNTQLEPCLHFLCRICFSKWMNRGESCPFCREPVRSFRRVILECNCCSSSNDLSLFSPHRNVNPSPSVISPMSYTSHKGIPPPIPQSSTSLSNRDSANSDSPPPIPRRHGVIQWDEAKK